MKICLVIKWYCFSVIHIFILYARSLVRTWRPCGASFLLGSVECGIVSLFLVWVDSFPVIHEYLRFVRLFKWDHMSAKPVKEGRINMVIVALNAFIHYYFANLLHFRVFWFFNSLIDDCNVCFMIMLVPSP